MKKEIEKAIEVARSAKESADEQGESWANEVDIQLMEAGIEVLSAVAYGAETDTRLVAVVEIDDAPIGIWRWDDGTWHAEPIRNPHAVELGRLGGQAKSEAKTQAARENAKKGGRPKLCKKIYASGSFERRCDRKSGHKGPCSGDHPWTNRELAISE
jgi:hypothetical protein